MNPILSLEQVSKSFGETSVLHPISFDLQRGERICILGPSGCGKSTLLQMVAGLTQASSGSLFIDGQPVEQGSHYVPPEKRPINMVFQDYALWPHMTVRQNMAYGLKRQKVSKQELDARLERLQKLLRLEGLLDRRPSELSGGQQQRVGIARALATEPSILLMDEPLSNLDIKLRTDMRNELASLLGQLSIATLYVTHDMMEAFAIADRILVLRDGAIDQLAKPNELFERPASPWVAQLMGYHNRLDAVVWPKEQQNTGAAVQLCEATIVGVVSSITGSPSNKQGTIMLHPESITVLDEGEPLTLASGIYPADQAACYAGADAMKRGERYNLLAAEVQQAIYEGVRWRLIVKLKDGQLVHTLHERACPAGQQVRLLFPAERTMIYILEH